MSPEEQSASVAAVLHRVRPRRRRSRRHRAEIREREGRVHRAALGRIPAARRARVLAAGRAARRARARRASASSSRGRARRRADARSCASTSARDVVWRPEHQRHANGATGLAAVAIVCEDLARAAQSRTSGCSIEGEADRRGAARRDGRHAACIRDRAVTRQALAELWISARPAPLLAALFVRVADRDAAARALEGGRARAGADAGRLGRARGGRGPRRRASLRLTGICALATP